VLISILPVFAENRFYFRAFQLADLSRQGVDTVRGALDDEGDDVDSFVPHGYALTTED
jgi:hypothetical protein